jgi:hypothetical protein
MSDLQPNDVRHKNTLTPGELVSASPVATFYNFASRCMD